MRRIFIFLGPPGAGKGTQAEMFGAERGLPHISTGAMLRASMDAGTELGNKVKAIVDSGSLVSDALMIDLIRDRVLQSDCLEGFLLDGFPRTIPQAEALDAFLSESSERIEAAVLFNISEEALMSRLTARRGTENRADDTTETQLKRIKVYEEQTAPLISFYREKSLLVSIDSNGTVDEVKSRLLDVFPLLGKSDTAKSSNSR